MPLPVLALLAEDIGGEYEDSPAVRAMLLPLLGHPSALVREGALLGLGAQNGRHMDEGARAAIGRVAAADASPSVRTTAVDVLS